MIDTHDDDSAQHNAPRVPAPVASTQGVVAMASHCSQAQRRGRSASQPIIAQALIWACMLIGSAILLSGTHRQDGVMLILLSGATTSLLLTTAVCRSSRPEADEPRR